MNDCALKGCFVGCHGSHAVCHSRWAPNRAAVQLCTQLLVKVRAALVACGCRTWQSMLCNQYFQAGRQAILRQKLHSMRSAVGAAHVRT